MAVNLFRGVNIRLLRRFSSLTEYTEKPEYPPIVDLSRNAKKLREKEDRANKFKSLETVEEKLIEANMPRYYGWRCVVLKEGVAPYDPLGFAQYVTRTHFIEQLHLPEYYSTLQSEEYLSKLVENIKSQLKDVYVFEHERFKSKFSDAADAESTANTIDKILIGHVNRLILSNLSAEYPHLQQCQVDYEPRIESAWLVGGFYPTPTLEKARKNHFVAKQDVGKPVDHFMQYLGTPVVQLRHEHPLPPVVDREESCSFVSAVPICQYDPRTIGFHMERRHLTNIPGFWPGDPGEFGLISFHSSANWAERTYDDTRDVPHTQAILASYGWLHALSCYQGFSTYNDIQYPFVTQTVLTDGQHWFFYVYQLNTTVLHSHHIVENPRCNICWGTPKMKLYEAFENGDFVGFDDNVLKHLLCFYLNIPKIQEGVELKPYLGSEIKRIADISDDERRVWLEKTFKHLSTNKPKHLLPDEIYHWEKIYKIDHDTLPLAPRRRPFELGINPFKRRLDDHCPEYVPKFKRKDKRIKWAKTYYP